ncbi:helicase associated domain-containing protein [Streptomyces sp. NPDC001315]|uniref:helicase associated domain-containing protein n=1 Tax=Streptomyces sp. NPDC001315 TaxID=3364562 RepID=UPI003684AC17
MLLFQADMFGEGWYNLMEPEHTNWKAGHRAAVAFRRAGDLAVPYEHRELLPGGYSFPLGRWLADQRRSVQAARWLRSGRRTWMSWG